ncbi:uncharacterized protein V1513DRAFT_453033 [Lipomyces chichibuensis]|uniref:uncharacterized protein n=1 Tax=Lipomyces chichibuensis TaxID=1546026 RepID=UPI00334345A7
MYSRRITENTKGCIIRILSGRLHLMPSVAINPLGAINVDLDSSTPMLAAPCIAMPGPERKLVPVLYITKFAYVGADGTDLLGYPQLLRQSKRVKAAIQLRSAVSRSIESVSPESPKTQKFKTPTQFQTPDQPIASEGNELANSVDNIAHEEKLETQEISVSDFATQPALQWTADSSNEERDSREIEHDGAVHETTSLLGLDVGDGSFEREAADTTVEFSRSEADVDANIDGGSTGEIPIPLEVPYKDGFLEIEPTIMSTTVFYRPLREQKDSEKQQLQSSQRGSLLQSIDHVSSTPVHTPARSSSPICSWSSSPPPLQRPPPMSTTQTTPITLKFRAPELAPVEYTNTSGWLQCSRAETRDEEDVESVQVQDSQCPLPNVVPPSSHSAVNMDEAYGQVSPPVVLQTSEFSSPIAQEELRIKTTNLPDVILSAPTSQKREMKRKRRHIVPRFTELDIPLDLESMLLEDRRKFKELITQELD